MLCMSRLTSPAGVQEFGLHLDSKYLYDNYDLTILHELERPFINIHISCHELL